jgi:hypothetical protein
MLAKILKRSPKIKRVLEHGLHNALPSDISSVTCRNNENRIDRLIKKEYLELNKGRLPMLVFLREVGNRAGETHAWSCCKNLQSCWRKRLGL